MTDRLAGKTALVTGAGSGIGLAVALAFATEGANLVINDVRTDGALEMAAGAVRALGRQGYPTADTNETAYG